MRDHLDGRQANQIANLIKTTPTMTEAEMDRIEHALEGVKVLIPAHSAIAWVNTSGWEAMGRCIKCQSTFEGLTSVLTGELLRYRQQWLTWQSDKRQCDHWVEEG